MVSAWQVAPRPAAVGSLLCLFLFSLFEVSSLRMVLGSKSSKGISSGYYLRMADLGGDDIINSQ